jgi:hypothetical protein
MKTNKDIIDFIQPRKREEIGDDYFNNLTAKIILENNKNSKSKIVTFYKKPIFWMSSVAAILIVMLIVRINENSIVNECDFNSVSNPELMAYVEDNIDEFDTEILGEYLPVELDTQNIKKENKIQESKIGNKEVDSDVDLFENLEKSDVLDYLDEEELTIEDLEN